MNRGEVLARKLNLIPYEYYGNTSERTPMPSMANLLPADWLGWMMLKVLRVSVPTTAGDNGRSYTPAELEFFWSKAQALQLPLPPKLQQQLESRQPSDQLWKAVSDCAGGRSVFTVTGRLRANATFCAARNTLFQGAAADGAILGLWNVWRGGHRIVNFVHDEIVVEAPSDQTTTDRAADVKARMIAGMHEVTPGMRVTVDSVITRSLNKADIDPRFVGGNPAQPAVTPATICDVPCDAVRAANTDGTVAVFRPDRSDAPTREIVSSQRTIHL